MCRVGGCRKESSCKRRCTCLGSSWSSVSNGFSHPLCIALLLQVRFICVWRWNPWPQVRWAIMAPIRGCSQLRRVAGIGRQRRCLWKSRRAKDWAPIVVAACSLWVPLMWIACRGRLAHHGPVMQHRPRLSAAEGQQVHLRAASHL